MTRSNISSHIRCQVIVNTTYPHQHFSRSSVALLIHNDDSNNSMTQSSPCASSHNGKSLFLSTDPKKKYIHDVYKPSGSLDYSDNIPRLYQNTVYQNSQDSTYHIIHSTTYCSFAPNLYPMHFSLYSSELAPMYPHRCTLSAPSQFPLPL